MITLCGDVCVCVLACVLVICFPDTTSQQIQRPILKTTSILTAINTCKCGLHGKYRH